MKMHKQLFRHDPDNGVFGDCYRTALACLLDLEPEDVPHIGHEHWADETGDKFKKHFEDWLATQGLATVYIPITADKPEDATRWVSAINPTAYYLLGGKSRLGCGHTVICHGGRIVHDPSPMETGIVAPYEDGYYWVTFLTPLSHHEVA